MLKPFSSCPACQGALYVSTLTCPDCGMELRNKFDLSPFDQLGKEKTIFLLSFLRNRGNLKKVQAELQISYPTAKRRLDEILSELNLVMESSSEESGRETVDVKNWITDPTSQKASEIIKTKLKENGGRVIVHTARGLPCEIVVEPDGVSFWCDKLPVQPYQFTVFDTVVELLRKQNGKARKGNGRNYRLGEENCDETTVVGYVAKNYFGKNIGDSVYDPVFALAAVLEWAGIAKNERGEIALTATYM